MTTPTGNGEGALTSSFRERSGLKVTGITDTMSTPRNEENILQQKEAVSFNKEVEDFKSVMTAGGGEWEDFIVRVHGYNRGGVDWIVTGGDVSLICTENISGGSHFCTENADVCTVNIHLDSKAELKPDWMYIKTTDTQSQINTASLSWEVLSYIFGGRVEELGTTMVETVEFKRFCEILLVQVAEGVSAHEVDCYPIVDTVIRPLECGTSVR
jgi:hypothetical protein